MKFAVMLRRQPERNRAQNTGDDLLLFQGENEKLPPRRLAWFHGRPFDFTRKQ